MNPVKDLPGPSEDLPARLGQTYGIPLTKQQPDAQGLLKLLDLHGHRWRGDHQFMGRLGDAAPNGRGVEGPELVDV